MTGAGSAPGVPRGSGCLTAARSATVATAAEKMMASEMFSAIRFFMAGLLGEELRSPQSLLVSGPAASARRCTFAGPYAVTTPVTGALTCAGRLTPTSGRFGQPGCGVFA